MRVRLLKDKLEGGVVKVTVRPRSKTALPWFAGTIHETSEATGEKLIAAGEAEAVPPETAEVPE